MEDVRVPTPWETLVRWFGPPRSYQLTRTLIFRLLGVVYVFAFLGLIQQGPAAARLARPHADRRRTSSGCTPRGATFWDAAERVHARRQPIGAIAAWAWVGLAISLARRAAATRTCRCCSCCGRSTAATSASASCGSRSAGRSRSSRRRCSRRSSRTRGIRGRSRRGRRRSTSIVLMRWLVFRIMLGAGLIKLRGDRVLDAT